MAVMGTENANGDFEIIDLRVPDLPRQPQRWERDDAQAVLAQGGKDTKAKRQNKRMDGGKVAIVSGLGISGDQADTMALDLFMEYLLGEAGGTSDQAEASKISRLLIAGNSINGSASLNSRDDLHERKTSKKYGYDSSAYNPVPTTHFDYFLLNLLPSIPITLLPGETDPANVSLPQQPIHPAMFPHSRRYAAKSGAKEPGWLDSVTNPWEGDVEGWRMMGNGGQPIDDIFKYVEDDDRLEMMEHLLRWRCGAPTAPDTLCKLIHRPYLSVKRQATSSYMNGMHCHDVQGVIHSKTTTLLSSKNVPMFTSSATNPNSKRQSLMAQPGKAYA